MHTSLRLNLFLFLTVFSITSDAFGAGVTAASTPVASSPSAADSLSLSGIQIGMFVSLGMIIGTALGAGAKHLHTKWQQEQQISFKKQQKIITYAQEYTEEFDFSSPDEQFAEQAKHATHELKSVEGFYTENKRQLEQLELVTSPDLQDKVVSLTAAIKAIDKRGRSIQILRDDKFREELKMTEIDNRKSKTAFRNAQTEVVNQLRQEIIDHNERLREQHEQEKALSRQTYAAIRQSADQTAISAQNMATTAQQNVDQIAHVLAMANSMKQMLESNNISMRVLTTVLNMYNHNPEQVGAALGETLRGMAGMHQLLNKVSGQQAILGQEFQKQSAAIETLRTDVANLTANGQSSATPMHKGALPDSPEFEEA